MTDPYRKENTVSATRVVVLVGSLRADSLNRRLAEHLLESAPDGARLELVEGLGELPFYNEDLDGESVPAAVATLRDQVAAADRVLVVTPEFNGTMPAVINNAIDWLSRPYGVGALKDKPFAAVGVSLGQYGGVWAHEDTRKSARVAGADVLDVSVSMRPEGDDPATHHELVSAVRGAVDTLVAHQRLAVA